MWANAQRDGLT